MNYKEKYEKALERARKLHSEPTGGTERIVCEQIFPELMESADEKIRKALITYFQSFPYRSLTSVGVNAKDVVAWLEKQGEKPQGKPIMEVWKDMRLEVLAQASVNRHEPNLSDDNTKMFSLNDIDEIIEKISKQNLANSAKTCKEDEENWSEEDEILHNQNEK